MRPVFYELITMSPVAVTNASCNSGGRGANLLIFLSKRTSNDPWEAGASSVDPIKLHCVFLGSSSEQNFSWGQPNPLVSFVSQSSQRLGELLGVVLRVSSDSAQWCSGKCRPDFSGLEKGGLTHFLLTGKAKELCLRRGLQSISKLCQCLL